MGEANNRMTAILPVTHPCTDDNGSLQQLREGDYHVRDFSEGQFEQWSNQQQNNLRA